MSLTRRLFMKSAAAVPLVAKTVVADLTAGTNIAAGQPYIGGTVAGPAIDSINAAIPPIDEPSILKQLARWSKPQQPGRADRRNATVLDADLAVNRSMSLTTKIRIQAERNMSDYAAAKRSFWYKRLDELKGIL